MRGDRECFGFFIYWKTLRFQNVVVRFVEDHAGSEMTSALSPLVPQLYEQSPTIVLTTFVATSATLTPFV